MAGCNPVKFPQHYSLVSTPHEVRVETESKPPNHQPERNRIMTKQAWNQQQIAQAFKMLQHLAQQAEAKPQTFGNISASLAKKDQQILRGFKRLGIKDVVLMDRSDKTRSFNVKPFKAWFAEGRVVRKGQHGVKGLFHVSQTDPLDQAEKPVAQPKAEKPSVVKSFADLAKLVTNDNQPA